MARIRTIKPDFWKHEALSELPEATHMLAAALLNYADDEGYFNANHRLVGAECCPLREPSVSVQDSLNMLARINYIRLGNGEDGKRYGQIVHFALHQKINRPTESKIKAVGIVWDGSCEPHAYITEPSVPEGNGREQGKEMEGEGEHAPEPSSGAPPQTVSDPPKETKRGTRLPDDFDPDPGEALALGIPLAEAITEAAKFKDHWKAKAGKDGVKLDWPATWRNWCRHAQEFRVRDGRSAKPQTIVADVVWLTEDDPRWPAACDRAERETGKRPFAVGGRNGQVGRGWHFLASHVPSEQKEKVA